MRFTGSTIGKSFIKGYMRKRMPNLSPEESVAMLNYMHQIFMRDGSTEYAIFVCFHVGMFAINPLEAEERLSNPDLNLPISFFYGDRDWMDHKAGRRVIERNRYTSS
jgi:cardiolipin-specific phospholipase